MFHGLGFRFSIWRFRFAANQGSLRTEGCCKGVEAV